MINPVRTNARLITAVNFGSIRTIVNGGATHATGRYSSAKTNSAQPWESKYERDLFLHCEVDHRVETYLAQPHRLEILVGEVKPLIFFPDVRRDMRDGSVEIVEVKQNLRKPDPDYVRKLALAEEIYAGLGWQFRVVIGQEFATGVRHDNVRYIQADRHVEFSLIDLFKVVDQIDHLGAAATYGEACAVISPGPQGKAKINAMICAAHIAIDLDQKLRASSPIYALDKGDLP